MTDKTFEEVVAKQLHQCTSTLVKKASEYDGDGTDRLHNFRIASKVLGCSLPKAVAGMMVKHTTSVYDMAVSEGEFCMDLWDEKITDHINYLLLLKAAIVEEKGKQTCASSST